MKLRIWCDSGANTKSRREVETTTEALGFTETEWEDMSEEQREEIVKEVAFERLDRGYAQVS